MNLFNAFNVVYGNDKMESFIGRSCFGSTYNLNLDRRNGEKGFKEFQVHIPFEQCDIKGKKLTTSIYGFNRAMSDEVMEIFLNDFCNMFGLQWSMEESNQLKEHGDYKKDNYKFFHKTYLLRISGLQPYVDIAHQSRTNKVVVRVVSFLRLLYKSTNFRVAYMLEKLYRDERFKDMHLATKIAIACSVNYSDTGHDFWNNDFDNNIAVQFNTEAGYSMSTIIRKPISNNEFIKRVNDGQIANINCIESYSLNPTERKIFDISLILRNSCCGSLQRGKTFFELEDIDKYAEKLYYMYFKIFPTYFNFAK